MILTARNFFALILLLLFSSSLHSQSGPAFFEYPDSFACQATFSPGLPVINQTTPGGSFSSTPTGLSLNPATGFITTSTSQPGSYTVTHIIASPSMDTHTVSMTVFEIPEATLSYPLSFVCKELYSTVSVDTIGGSGFGVFSASPPGLSINPTTGEIDVTASSTGIYDILHVVSNGPCNDSATFSMEINELTGFQIDYGVDTICPVDTIAPTLSGTVPSGVFAAVPGLAYANASTGAIDLSATTPDRTYIIRFIETGGCNREFRDTIYVAPFDDATFSYGTSLICDNIDSLPVTIPGDPGLFSWIGNLVIDNLAIDPNTGTIYPPLSDPGTYSITQQTNGLCPSTYTDQLIVASSPAPFNLINNNNTSLEAPVPGIVSWYCDSILVLTNSYVLIPTQMGVYWAVVENSNGCTTMSNVINTDPTGTLEEELLRQSLKVFPNPSNGVFNIHSDLTTGGAISAIVFDLQGQKIDEQEFSAWSGGTIDLNEHATGTYFLRLFYESTSITYKLIKTEE